VPRTRALELATFVAVLVVTIVRAPGGPGWLGDGGAVVAATDVSVLAGRGPLATVLGALVGLLPLGEPAFRLALLGAVGLAATCAGVVAVARALTPTAAGAGAIAGALLAVTPAGAVALPTADGALAAALVVWTLAGVAARRRTPDEPWSRTRAVWAAIAVGALAAIAPVLGLVLALPVAWVHWGCVPGARRLLGLVPAVVVFALAVAPVLVRGGGASLAPLGEVGPWRALGLGGGDVGALIARLGDGAGAALLFAGLVGLGLGAATGLRGAGVVLATAVGLAIAAALTAPPVVALAVLAAIAAGVGPLAAAIARLGPAEHRTTIATIAAVPIAIIAVVAPRRLPAPPPASDGVARVAADLLGPVAPGPGVFFVTTPAIASALRHERAVAGLRPDLAVAVADDRRAVQALRAGMTVASDSPSFGRLDLRRARPTGRGFTLLREEAEPASDAAVPPPAGYPGEGGRAIAAYLAVERARYEANRGHLDRAARAAGLVGRFGAADLAILAGTVPGRARPPMFGFVPTLTPGALPPPWLPELFGDDLAWVADLPAAPLPADAPAERRLHALWRDILSGTRTAGDPAIAAMGLAAERATVMMLADVHRGDAAEQAARVLLARHEDAATLLALGSLLAERGGLGDGAPPDDAARALLAEAEAVLGRAVTADPTSVDALIVRGLVQHRLGKVDEARRSWQRAQALDPQRADVRDLLTPATGEPAPAQPAP